MVHGLRSDIVEDVHGYIKDKLNFLIFRKFFEVVFFYISGITGRLPSERAHKDAVGSNFIAARFDIGDLLQSYHIDSRNQHVGLDPLYVANEGKLIAVCAADDAPKLLAAMRAHPLARNAAVIGTVISDDSCFVQMQTKLGGRRMVDWLNGDQLPRIC